MSVASADDKANNPSGLERLGRYEMMVELGRGPTGPVWAAYIWEGSDQGRIVAVRRIPLNGDRSLKESIMRGGQPAMRLRDPRVLAVLDVDAQRDELLVASEFVEGESVFGLLREAIRQKAPIPTPIALCIAQDVARALHSASGRWKTSIGCPPDLHSAVHGGLSPEHVVVAAFGDSMLTEVGIASLGMRHSRFLNTVGGLPYRAPEQLKKDVRVDARTDVFVIGILLWEMLANRPLFGRNDRFQRSSAAALSEGEARDVTNEVLRAPIPKLDSVQRPGAPIPAPIVRLVSKALERDPMRRFRGLEDLLGAIAEMPRGSVSAPELVVAAVERLARPAIAARKAAIETLAGVRASISPPESRRSTRPPGKPEAPVEIVNPAVAPLPPLGTIGNFPFEEAPTARRRTPQPGRISAADTPMPGVQLIPPMFGDDEKPTTPQGDKKRGPAEGEKTAVMPTAELMKVVEASEAAEGESDNGLSASVPLMSGETPSPLATLTKAAKKLPVPAWAGIGVAVAAIIGLVIWKSSSKPDPTPGTSATAVHAAVSAPAVSGPPAVSVQPARPPEPESLDVEPATSAAPSAEPASTKESRPVAPPDRGGERVHKKPFRPKGI